MASAPLPAGAGEVSGTLEPAELAGATVYCGVVERPDPVFDLGDAAHHGRVLVKKRGFACSFRDRGTVLEVARHAPPGACYELGSELVGEVVAVGPGVDGLRSGDRVIGDYAFPQCRAQEPAAGVPSNHTSRELELCRADRLLAIPDELPDEVAAGFTVGAQTAYSMVRRLAVQPGETVLVTSARSNTALFVLAALRTTDARVFAVTTAAGAAVEPLAGLGVEEVFTVPPGRGSFFELDGLGERARALGGFDAVVDPFFDLHLVRAVPVLATGGRYVTCGLLDQAAHVEPRNLRPEAGDLTAVVRALMLKNARLLGNCIGTTADLAAAVRDYVAGDLRVTVDSVHRPPGATGWLTRTFAAPERCGKTPFLYA